jgi:hypothetical protein
MLLNITFDLCLNMVFNCVVKTNTEQIMSEDKSIIQDLGGPTRVAELLGYDKLHGGVQRVQNWMLRGIPARVKLEHPEIFLKRVVEKTSSH